MPHVVLERAVDLSWLGKQMPRGVVRWRHAVLKTEAVWHRIDHPALLVEGVVIENSRPLRPVALIAPRDERLVVRLWPIVVVERTTAVRRWLAVIASACSQLGSAGVVVTNIAEDILIDLPGLR